MAMLIKGKWDADAKGTTAPDGSFVRAESPFRNQISPQGEGAYPAEAKRYNLIVSYACPWAHRTLIFRKLKNLENHISVDYVHPDMLEMGWSFEKTFPGVTGDSLHNKKYVHQIYQLSDKDISTKATVPILWDKKTNTIVNNESSEIIRIMNDAFNDITKNKNVLNNVEIFRFDNNNNFINKIIANTKTGKYLNKLLYISESIVLFNALIVSIFNIVRAKKNNANIDF